MNDNDDDMVSILSNAPSMQTTVEGRPPVFSLEDDDGSIETTDQSVDPFVGMTIEAVSVVTTQTIDLDYLNAEETPRPNLGDPQKDYSKHNKKWEEDAARMALQLDQPEAGSDEESSNITGISF